MGGYLLAKQFRQKYEDVLTFTKDWKKSEFFRGMLGTYRAGAYKRKAESIHDLGGKLEILRRASSILTDVFESEGFVGSGPTVAIKILEEVVYTCERDVSECPQEILEQLLKFADTYAVMAYEQSDLVMELPELARHLAALNVKNNPFQEKKWIAFNGAIESRNPKIQERIDGGDLLVTRVVNIPESKGGKFSKFVIVGDLDDLDNKRYFVVIDYFKSGGWDVWQRLRIGANMAIKVNTDETPPTGKLQRASEAYLL